MRPQRKHGGRRRRVRHASAAMASSESCGNADKNTCKAGFVANQLDTPRLWTHHVMAGTRQNIKVVHAELKKVLEIVARQVTCKPSKYLGRILMKIRAGYSFGIDHENVGNLHDEKNITALKSSTELRWERRENDDDELPASL